jgi:hypothetical protein
MFRRIIPRALLGLFAAVLLSIAAASPALARRTGRSHSRVPALVLASGDGAISPVARPLAPAWRRRAPPETVNSLNMSMSPGFSRAPAR